MTDEDRAMLDALSDSAEFYGSLRVEAVREAEGDDGWNPLAEERLGIRRERMMTATKLWAEGLNGMLEAMKLVASRIRQQFVAPPGMSAYALAR